MSDVIHHDFGKAPRETRRKFRKLIGLDALHEQNIKDNPLPYLERASERIFQLEKALFEAVQAAKPQNADNPTTDKIEVDKADYQRLLDAIARVEKALAESRAAEDLI